MSDEQVRPSSLMSFHRSPFLSTKHSTYFHVYDRLFGTYAGRELTFVEIGVLNGGSLFMWRDFFGEKARIIGIDLNPAAKKWEEHGFEIFIGSQQSPNFWQDFFAKVGDIDILLDDGGHTFEQQIVTCYCATQHIRDGGLLVVEDTHTSYMPEFGGPNPLSFISYAKNIVDGINHRFSAFASCKESEKVIASVQFFESIVAFEVNRVLAAIPSEQALNAGKPSNAKDFRYQDRMAITASELMKAFRY